MALPKAVQRQVEDVNRLVGALNAPPEEKPEPKAKLKAAPEPPPAPEEGQEPEDEGQQVEAQQEGQEPEAEGQQEPAKASEEQTWEQRYRVLQGKYNSEVPRISRELRQAQEQISSLQGLLANMQTMQKKQPEHSPEVARAAQKLVRPEEIEEYGDDFLDLVGRRAQEVSAPLVNSLTDRLKKLEAQLGGVSTKVEQTEKHKVISQLAHRVKNWEELNEDDSFLNWLDQPEPYSGVQRGKLLQEAFEKGNAERVIAFFEGYLTEHAAVQRGPENSGTEARTPRVPLKELVAPGKPKAGTAGAQQEKRIWSRQEIQQFFADSTKGKFKNKPEEYNRLYADIIAAGNENRVR